MSDSGSAEFTRRSYVTEGDVFYLDGEEVHRTSVTHYDEDPIAVGIEEQSAVSAALAYVDRSEKERREAELTRKFNRGAVTGISAAAGALVLGFSYVSHVLSPSIGEDITIVGIGGAIIIGGQAYNMSVAKSERGAIAEAKVQKGRHIRQRGWLKRLQD